MCLHMLGLFGNLFKVATWGHSYRCVVTSKPAGPSAAQGVSEAGETQAEAALHPRTTHIKMPPVLLAWGLTHLSTNMEDVSFFMRSRFPMCEYQELLAHDDCRCLSHTVVFNLILTFVW